MKTTSETQREELAKYLIALIDEKEQDITTGIEEGLYNKAENAPVLKELRQKREKALDLIDTNVNVIIQVRGGLVTHVCSDISEITVKVLDYDNAENGDAGFDEDDLKTEALAKMATARYVEGRYLTCW